MDWARMLACVTGTVDQELLARNEYLTAENRILKAQLNGRLKLSDAERSKLGEIGHRLGRTALAEVATVAKPDTILAWYRKLVAHKFGGSKARRGPGRPRITRKVEQLIVRLAEENRDWVMTGLPGRRPIWDIVYAIRRSAMSCSATVCRQRRSASARPPGRR
jgi:putative transposase